MKNIFYSISILCLLPFFVFAQWSDNLHFTGKIDSVQSSTSSPAVGVINISYDASMDTACVDISVKGLSGVITGIHIHQGAAGVSGGVIVNLNPYINGNRITAKITSGLDWSKLMQGMYYVNVHTAANPAGEIRGQIWPEADYMYHTWLDTTYNSPTLAGGENPVGLATFRLGKSKKWMNVRCIADDLTGAVTSAHLHMGGAGTSGAVMVDLSSMINGNSIEGAFDASAVTGLWDSLEAGSVYLNLHTTANAGGEIRGQLMRDKHLTFDAWLDTAQLSTAPTVTGTPMGLAYTYFSWDMDTLWYDLLAYGLSDSITAIHIHDGLAGTGGAVSHDMSSGINGNRVMGMITGLSASDAAKMLRGENYINLHTAANANGEIRGQLYKYARNGYNMWLNGDQQSPAISVNGMGSGIVSVDRDMTNAHIMVVYSGLTDSTLSAHFHNAPVDSSGPVIYDLSSWLSLTGNDDAAFGYWDSADVATPFNSSHAAMFWDEEMYINVHTDAYNSGELRSQTFMNSACDMLNTNTEKLQSFFSKFEIFPNPSEGRVNMILITDKPGDYTVQVHNLLGKTLLSNNVSLYKGDNLLDLDISDFSNAVYFISISSGNQVYTRKVIKQ